MDPFLWRRHLASCAHKSKGRSYRDCACPVWSDGYAKGKRLRQSMETSDWNRAERRLLRLVDPEATPPGIPVGEAVNDYLEDCAARSLAASTLRSYRTLLSHLEEFCQQQHYTHLQHLTLEALTKFRRERLAPASRKKGCKETRPLRSSSSRKELEALRAFCAFAVERAWIPENFAKKLKPPREPISPTLPFDQDEVDRILKACALLKNNNELSADRARVRAKALVLLLLYAGLRISDAAKLERSKLNRATGQLLIRMMKTGAALYVRLPPSALCALDSLPRESSRYFFWTGQSKVSTIVGSLRRSVECILKTAGIKGHPHRFRDTFAVRLLENDVPIRTVSLLLGHTSIKTTEKHYAPFVASQQRLLDAAVATLDFGESGSLGKPPRHAVQNRFRNAKSDVRAATA